MLTVDGQFHKYAPPYEEGEILTLPNSMPRRVQLLLLGADTNEQGEPVESVRWWGLAGDEVYFHPGTVFEPIPSEGEDPASGAFKYLGVVDTKGVIDVKVK